MNRKVVVDRSLCDGNGLCAREAPDVFELQEDDTLRLLREDIPESLADSVRRAVEACPKAALKITED